jgi:hypothetical protein
MNEVFFAFKVVALRIDQAMTLETQYKLTAADENNTFKLCGNDKRDLRSLFTKYSRAIECILIIQV